MWLHSNICWGSGGRGGGHYLQIFFKLLLSINTSPIGFSDNTRRHFTHCSARKLIILRIACARNSSASAKYLYILAVSKMYAFIYHCSRSFCFLFACQIKRRNTNVTRKSLLWSVRIMLTQIEWRILKNDNACSNCASTIHLVYVQFLCFDKFQDRWWNTDVSWKCLLW